MTGGVEGARVAARRYAFIGSPARCERHQACATMSQWGPTGQSTPNYNAEADGMASIISHELTEAVTDPELNAWCARLRPACTVTLRWPQLKVMECC
jgi:hypothetical protein